MHLIKSSTILALFLLCARWVSMGQSTVQTNGLVLHYPFNGSPQEILGNLPPPTTANLVAVPDRHGSVGSAYGFDGLNSTIAQPESVLNIGQTDYSISFGFKTDDVEKAHQGLINTIPHNGLYVVFNHPPFTGTELSRWEWRRLDLGAHSRNKGKLSGRAVVSRDHNEARHRV